MKSPVMLLSSSEVHFLLSAGQHLVRFPGHAVPSDNWCGYIPFTGPTTVTTEGLKYDVGESTLTLLLCVIVHQLQDNCNWWNGLTMWHNLFSTEIFLWFFFVFFLVKIKKYNYFLVSPCKCSTFLSVFAADCIVQFGGLVSTSNEFTSDAVISTDKPLLFISNGPPAMG